MYEKIVHCQLYEYFKDKGLFYASQYGFRSKHSTELAAVEYIDFLKCEIDNGHVPLSLFIDLTKDF